MRRDNSDFKTNFISEAGTFPNNKDYFAFMEFDDFACWVVANGIDSDEEKKSAEIAVKSIFSDFSEKPTMSKRKIKKYIMNAQRVLEEESTSVRLKSSLMMIVTDYAKIIWVCSGNARIYHFRKGRFNFKSKDQSLAQMMADAGKIDEYEIDNHEEKNNLVNYLGKPNNFKPFISRTYKLNDGDVLLLCTSGVWEKVNSIDMVNSLKETKEPFEFLDNLEDVFLSRQNKIVNNYTMASIFVNKAFKESNKDKIDLIKKIALTMIPVILLTTGVVVYKIKDAKKRAEALAALVKHEKNGDEFVKDGIYDKALIEYKDAQGYLKKIKIKNKLKEKQLDKKCKITELIANGDKNFKGKDYEKALEDYKKAKKESKRRKDYDQKELDDKIAKTQSFIDVLNAIKKADEQLENNDGAGAKEAYEKAKKLADKASFEDAKKDLKAKIKEADTQIADIDKKQKDVESNKLEKLGDENYQSQQYDKAIQFYQMAQELYQELNNLQGVLSMQKKIDNAASKLTPLVPPPAINNTNVDQNGM